MKTILLSLGLALFAITSLKAQKHQPSADYLMEASEKLELSADQTAQIEQLSDGLEASLKEIKSSDMNKEQKMAKGKAAWDGFMSDVEGILTPEQMEMLDQMVTEFENKVEAKLKKVEANIERVKKELNITDEQAVAFKQNMVEFSKEAQTLKSSGLSNKEKRKELKNMLAKEQAALAEIFTPEQLTQIKGILKEMRKNRKK